MKLTTLLRGTAFAFAATTALTSSGMAAQFDITVTNTASTGGLFLTPFLSIFHDGSFDTFSSGTAASAGVEALAEDGNFNPEKTRAEMAGHTTAVVFGPNGFGSTAPQPPLLDAGESSTIRVNLDPASDVFFSFLSMILPSNDNFIGNDNPMAYRLFDASGVFTGLHQITVLGSQVWDSGTEVNNLNGAPFSGLGGTATDTTGVVTSQMDLSYILGTPTPVGTVSSVPAAQDILATIRFSQVAAVPLPAALPLLLAGLGGLGVAGARRKKA